MIPKKIEFSYKEAPNEDERLEKIIDLLSEGVYAYLKKQGLLKKDPIQSERIKELLEKTKPINSDDELSI